MGDWPVVPNLRFMTPEQPPHDGGIGDRGLLVFDGECGFCRRWVRHMNEWFRRHPDTIAWQRADLASLHLTAEQCSQAVQFVDARGRVSGGSDAAARVLIVAGFPFNVAGRLMLLPGVRSVASATYKWVARNRHRFTGDPA